MMDEVLKNIRKIENNLSVNVKISCGEVERITVQRLIEIRNADLKRDDKFLESFDYVLRFFLMKDEFKKYVIDKNEIK
jgi:hypothetical protein